MNASDIPFVLAVIAVGLVMTGIVFFILRGLKVRSGVLRVVSATAFPALLIAIIVYVEVRNPDPHGIVLAAIGFLVLVSLPITMLATAFLVRRFG